MKGIKKHNAGRKDHKDKSHKVEETDEKLEKKCQLQKSHLTNYPNYRNSEVCFHFL